MAGISFYWRIQMGKSKKKNEKKTRTPKNFSREKPFPEGWTSSLENSEEKKHLTDAYAFNFPRQKSLRPPEN